MARGSGFTSRGPLRAPIGGDIRAPGAPSGAEGAARAAGIFGGLAGQFNLLGENLVERDFRQGLEQAQQAGEAAGIEAARSGQALAQREVGFFSRREDEAFNRAAEVGYAQGLEVEIRSQRAELEAQHEADPDAFMKAWDAYQADVMKRVPPSMLPNIQLLLDQHGNAADFALARQKKERADAQAAFNVRLNADQIATDAVNAARQAGNPLAAADQLQLLNERVKEGVDAGWFTPTQGAAIVASTRDQVIAEGYFGMFMRDPSAAGLQAFAETDTPELTPDQKDQLVGRMRQELARRESAARAEHARLGKRVAAAVELLDRGGTVDPAGLAELQQEVLGTEYEKPFALTVEAYKTAQHVKALPLEEQQAAIAEVQRQRQEIQARGVPVESAIDTAAALDQLARLEKSLVAGYNATVEAIDKGRAMDRAQELGVVDLEPLDFTDSETLDVSLEERVRAAEVVEEHFGIQRPGSILTAGEVEGFANMLRPGAAPTETQIAVLQALYERLGPERLGAVMEQVAGKEPAVAFAAGLPPDRMAQALTGRAILAQNPQVAPSVNEQAARNVVSEVYGDVLAGKPRTLKNAVEAARWLYAARKAEQGDLTGQLDADAWEQALKDSIGGKVEWTNGNGLISGDASVIIPPRPDMTDEDFEDLMDSLSDADLRAGGQVPVTAQGQPVSAGLIRRYGKLRSVGDGQYQVTVGEFGLIDQDGQPYILDLGAALDRPPQDRALDRIHSMTLEELQALDMSALTQEQALAVAERAAQLAEAAGGS